MGFFSDKKTTFDPMSMYTPQQKASINALMSLASTGTGGGITLGEGYSGDLGYYTQTAGEQQALQGIQSLLSGDALKQAGSVYSSMANTQFNPDDPSSGYAAFSRALAKAGKESEDVLNREAAMTGSRFGTAIAGEKANLAADLANQRGMFLADLYNQSQNRALQGASGLQSLTGQQSDLYQQLASQASIERLLKDQQAKEQYQEFNRSRNEELKRIGLMQDQWSNPMGTITTKSPSTFSKIASPLFGAIGMAVSGGNPMGYQIGSSIGSGIGNATSGVDYDVSSGSNLNFSLSNLFSNFGSGNVQGTGLFGGKLGGQTQSEILGYDTRKYRSR